LLITNQRTGSGGLQYTLDYIGRESFEGIEKSHVFITDPNDTDSEVRDQLTTMIGLGLVQYVQDIPGIMSRLSINYLEAEGEEAEEEGLAEDDPWNLWVFRVGVNGGMEGEAQQRGYRLNGFASARRIDEDFKFEFSVNGRYNYDEFDETNDEDSVETIVNIQENYRSEILGVWSLSPHSSIGGLMEISKSTFVNRDLGIETGPAYEYNIFPYSESTRRLLTVQYVIGIAYYDYELETVEGRTEDRMGLHMLSLNAEIQQPWGEIDASISGTQYFTNHESEGIPHRINTFVSLEYRIFRGFEIDIFGFYSRIKDQFFLPAEGLSQEEILLRRRQRETDFRFNFGVGLSYRFGSKYANVVNPRID
jgi:hypothetical protein